MSHRTNEKLIWTLNNPLDRNLRNTVDLLRNTERTESGNFMG